MRPLAKIVIDLESAQRTEDERAARVRARFEERTGHPRGVAVIGAEGAIWRELEAADPPDHSAPDALVEEAVSAYLDADAAGRAGLREVFDRSRYLRWRVGWGAGEARFAMAAADVAPELAATLCRRVLAAAALDGGASDPRDTIVALDGLYVAAVRAALDPEPLFQRAADDARSTDGQPTPASRLLAMYLDPDRARALRRSALRVLGKTARPDAT